MRTKAKRMIYFLLAATLAVLVYFGWSLTTRTGYESAEYMVLETDGPYEIREYPDLMMATTPTKVSSQGEDGSFMRLFRYISGGNEQKQKVAMTTPVFMEGAGDRGQMGFVIPKKFGEDEIPEPAVKNVQIEKRRGGRFAVIRFNGRLNQNSIAEAETKLRSWTEAKNQVAEGNVEMAGYDPPWTPGWFRRNEVLIRLQ